MSLRPKQALKRIQDASFMGQLSPRWIMPFETDLNIATLLIKTPTSHDSSSPRSPIISVKGESGNSASPDSAVEVAGEESR